MFLRFFLKKWPIAFPPSTACPSVAVSQTYALRPPYGPIPHPCLYVIELPPFCLAFPWYFTRTKLVTYPQEIGVVLYQVGDQIADQIIEAGS